MKYISDPVNYITREASCSEYYFPKSTALFCLFSFLSRPQSYIRRTVCFCLVCIQFAYRRCYSNQARELVGPTRKHRRTFLFCSHPGKSVPNLSAGRRCQKNAKMESISFSQEGLGHARVSQSWLIISATDDAFLPQQLDLRREKIGQFILKEVWECVTSYLIPSHIFMR